MFNVFTGLSRLVPNLCTIVSDGLASSSASGAVARLWQLRICSCASNWLYSGNGRRKRSPPLLPTDCILHIGSLIRLAWCIDDRQTSDSDWLASERIPNLLALEVETGWEARVTVEVRDLVRRLATENPTCGEQRIADELLLKLRIQLSPRIASKYIKQLPRPRG